MFQIILCISLDFKVFRNEWHCWKMEKRCLLAKIVMKIETVLLAYSIKLSFLQRRKVIMKNSLDVEKVI